MKKFISAVIAAALAAAAFPTTLTASAAEETTPAGLAYSAIGDSITDFITEREAGLASCEVSVFNGSGVIYNGYYGFSDIENSIPANDQTVYEWGSTSKILVWTSVMQQYEQGHIDLTADIRTYLPEGFLTKLQYPEETITMLDLMSHRAGFQESFYENQEAAPDDVYDSLEDAVRACECYQAFHVGEHTSYSNWGTALAAYIVEQVSGEDYVTYVNEHIFQPLGMAHTAIDPMQRDNAWVDEKRGELKCYSRYDDEKYNQDLGECRYAVQLFPAGAAIGTLEDLTKLGQAFVSEDCPLFEDTGTREEMLTATSYFGDTNIAKNCHGLWTQQRAVQTVGHDGNTGGCTATLEFDPVSGLGIAVLTNEPGETAFCSGLPVLLFGHMTDRPEYRNATMSTTDISGVYFTKRAIIEGAARAGQFMGAVYPLTRNADGSYSLRLFGFQFADGFTFTSVGEDQYILTNNGMESFSYIKDGIYEMGYMDYERSKTGALPMAASYGFIIFGILCLAILLVELIVWIVRKARGTEKTRTFSDRQVIAQQLIYGVSGVIFALLVLIIGGISAGFTAVSGVLAGILGLISLANGGVLCYNTIKDDKKALAKAGQLVWAVLGAVYTVFILVMQVYRFWTL